MNFSNTWTGIKSIISMKSSSSNSEMLLTYQNDNNDYPERIANIFNNHFSTIGEKKQTKIKHSHKHTDYLTNENSDSFFLSPANNKEIKIILSFKISKNLLNHIVSLERF